MSTATADADQLLADARPLLTRALHALLPQLPLIDCAQVANRVLDEAAEGDCDAVRGALAVLDGVLAAHGDKP